MVTMSDIAIVNATIAGRTNTVPIGPLLIVAVLENEGYEVVFRDYQTAGSRSRMPSPQTFYEFVRELDSPIVGISAMAGNLPTVLGAIRRLKKEEPDRIIVLGGAGATDAPDQILRHFPVDIIVRGEGEETTLELMAALKTGTKLDAVAGISFQQDGQIIHTPNRPRITNLDRLPFPAYHKIDFADYYNGLHVMTSRGCPYNCGFCSAHTIWQRRVTNRSIENVIHEIKGVRDQITWITFCDDNLMLSPQRILDLCRRLREEELDIPWMSYGRINLATKEIIQEMAAAGCQEVFYGIESGSNRVLEILRKKLRIEDTFPVLEMSADYIQQVNTSFIWGYPFETTEDFYDTILALGQNEQLSGVTPHFYLLGPLLNTPIYQEYGHLTRFDINFFPNVSTIPINEHLTNYPELVELVQGYPDLFVAYYHYDHETLPAKRRVISTLNERRGQVEFATADRELPVFVRRGGWDK